MAIIFELWLEAEDEAGLEALQAYFTGMEHTLLSGKAIRFRADIENNDARGLCVWSPQICPNGRGIETLAEALDATEAGIFLYSRLREAPDFRFALVGWDVENSAPSSELSDYVTTGLDGRKHWVGFECVLNEKLCAELGSPLTFWPFRDGYVWRKYAGETYMPLYCDDQEGLRKLCGKLLPNNFDR